jgi:hypothetical protein
MVTTVSEPFDYPIDIVVPKVTKQLIRVTGKLVANPGFEECSSPWGEEWNEVTIKMLGYVEPCDEEDPDLVVDISNHFITYPVLRKIHEPFTNVRRITFMYEKGFNNRNKASAYAMQKIMESS